MKKLYVIIPCVLVLIFAWFERSARRERERLAELHEQGRLAAQAELDARRAGARRQAEEDARARAAAREAQEQLRETTRLHDHQNALRAANDQTNEINRRVAHLQRELIAAEARLTTLRAEQLDLDTATFELARNVELQRIDRRSAELELQRTTQMVAARLRESEWATRPLPIR